MRTILLFMFTCSLWAQSFQYGPEGMTDYVVIEAEGKNAEELYTKTKLWVMDFFASPDDVIKVDIPNQKIRFFGSSNNGIYEHTYQIEVEFKDGRYKVDPVYLNIGYGGYDWDINMNDGSAHFNNKGKMKAILSKDYIKQIPSELNNVEKLLYEYIMSGKDDDW